MNLALEQYAHLDSPLHRWDPRCKLVGFICLIFAFSFVRELYLIPAMIMAAGIIVVLSRLPLPFVIGRLRYPSFFLLVAVLLLPFISGSHVLVSLGPIDIHEEGLKSVLLITARFLSILTVGIVLFGTGPFLTTIKAMRSLGLPATLADIMLLAFRYLFEIGDYLHRMEVALRLRGFRARRLSLRGLGTLGWLGGTILVRSFERSEWVYRAMLLRGYGQGQASQESFRLGRGDVGLLVVFILLAVGFVTGQLLL